MIVSDEVVKRAIDAWISAFRKRPKITLLATFLALSLTIGFVTIMLIRDANREKELASKNANYHTQLEKLQQTEASVKELMAFVQDQKKRLNDSESLVQALKAEEDRLHPIVQADRKTVDAILAVQAENQSRGVWTERWIGFGLGVVASIVAAVIFEIMRMLHRRVKAKPSVINVSQL